MPVIDVHRTWAKVEERLAVEDDPIRRRNLEVVLEHMKAEARGDIDGLLATLSDAVAYHAYGTDEPMLNPVWVLLGTGERPSPWALVGAALIIASLATRAVLAQRGRARAVPILGKADADSGHGGAPAPRGAEG